MGPITLDDLSSFAHDLRTPLAAIGGFVQLLEIGVHGEVSPAQASALERIRVNQEQAIALITEFMNIAERRLRDHDASTKSRAFDPTFDSTFDADRP